MGAGGGYARIVALHHIPPLYRFSPIIRRGKTSRNAFRPQLATLRPHSTSSHAVPRTYSCNQAPIISRRTRPTLKSFATWTAPRALRPPLDSAFFHRSHQSDSSNSLEPPTLALALPPLSTPRPLLPPFFVRIHLVPLPQSAYIKTLRFLLFPVSPPCPILLRIVMHRASLVCSVQASAPPPRISLLGSAIPPACPPAW